MQRHSRDHLALHLEEETKARIEEERQGLQYSESGISAMQAEEQRLIDQLRSLHVAEQDAMMTLQATNAYDPFSDGLDLAAMGVTDQDASETTQQPQESPDGGPQEAAPEEAPVSAPVATPVATPAAS